MSVNPLYVTKISGEKELYSEDKIRRSASRIGVPKDIQARLVEELRTKIYDGIPTSEIFKIIKSYLQREKQIGFAAKYNLKSGLQELGPSGYPFEKFIAEVLKEIGYSVKINQILAGKCVRHEIDVIAEKDGITYEIEAKFHSKPGIRTDIKVPLYIKARYDDILANWEGDQELKPWVINNTRFTSEAILYAECVQLKLTSWDYPESESLRELIEATKLHPITVLDSLSRKNREALLQAGIVSCKQLISEVDLVKNIISERDYHAALEESQAVCQDHT